MSTTAHARPADAAAIRGPRGRRRDAARVRRGRARGAAGPAALPQRDRQVQHPPRVDCVGCGRCVEAVPARRARPARRLSARHPAARLPLHRAGLREDRPLLRRRLSAEGAVAVATIRSFETHGRLPLDAGPDREHLADGRDGPRRPASTWRARSAASGGGFDRLRFRFPDAPPAGLRREDISTELLLNRRNDSRPKVTSTSPGTAAACRSARSTSAPCWARPGRPRRGTPSPAPARAATPTASCPTTTTSSRRWPPGCSACARRPSSGCAIVEFKYAQGAKPGLGGHLLGDKNTPGGGRACARRSSGNVAVLALPVPQRLLASKTTRSTSTGSSTSTRGRWSRSRSPRPTDVDMVAVGVYYAGAHIVHLDGSYGGTGAAPNIAKKNIAMPIEYAIGQVHQFLVGRGHPRRGHADRQRRHPHALRRRQGHRPGRRRRGHRHGGTGGPGLHPLRAAARAGAAARAASPPPTPNCWSMIDRRVGHAAADQPVQRLARDAGRHPVPPGARVRGARCAGRTDLLTHLDYENEP